METDQKIYNPRRRRGRPPLLDIERRVGRIQPGFTISEYQLIAEKAATCGITESEYVRAAALGRDLKSVSQINKDTYHELQRIAVNVNQIAKELNSKGSTKNYDALNKLSATITQLRKELLGAH